MNEFLHKKTASFGEAVLLITDDSGRIFPSEPRAVYEIDIALILSDDFIIMEGEAFAYPAYQEPGTADKNEKLQDPVDEGVHF